MLESCVALGWASGTGADTFPFCIGDGAPGGTIDVVNSFDLIFDALQFSTGGNADYLGMSGGVTGNARPELWYEHTTLNGFGNVTIVHVRDGEGLNRDFDVARCSHIALTEDDMIFG